MKIDSSTTLINKLLCDFLARVCSFDGYGTLNQQTGSVEHFSLVTVGSTCVGPSVVSSDAKDGQSAIMYLRLHVQEKQINNQNHRHKQLNNVTQCKVLQVI